MIIQAHVKQTFRCKYSFLKDKYDKYDDLFVDL